MNLKQIGMLAGGAVLVWAGWQGWGWAGVMLVVGGILMWMLLHFTRMMRVLQQASKRPVGWCPSAVMLNAKLQPKVNLLHVTALTKSLGEQLSDKEAQPEVFRWTDNSASSVTCEFQDGKLVKWTLYRPPEGEPPAQ